MKLKLKYFLTITLLVELFSVSIAASNYEAFLTGLSKSFEIKDDLLKDCMAGEWKSNNPEDLTKSLDKFKVLLPDMKIIREGIKGPNVMCTFKNKIKEHLLSSVKKAAAKAEKDKAKTAASPPTPNPPKFLQVDSKLKRSGSTVTAERTKWGIFSTIQNKIPDIMKKWVDFAKCPMITKLVKNLECVSKSSKADYKAKNGVETFKQGIENIAVNINGFVDFEVNFICDKINLVDAFNELNKGDVASAEADRWSSFGRFVGKIYESMHDNKLTAR